MHRYGNSVLALIPISKTTVWQITDLGSKYKIYETQIFIGHLLVNTTLNTTLNTWTLISMWSRHNLHQATESIVHISFYIKYLIAFGDSPTTWNCIEIKSANNQRKSRTHEFTIPVSFLTLYVRIFGHKQISCCGISAGWKQDGTTSESWDKPQHIMN